MVLLTQVNGEYLESCEIDTVVNGVQSYVATGGALLSYSDGDNLRISNFYKTTTHLQTWASSCHWVLGTVPGMGWAGSRPG